MAEDNQSHVPSVGVSLNSDPDLLRSLLPFFESGKIQTIEWSFDTVLDKQNVPAWLNDLLTLYSNEQRLLGHGVFYSLLDAKWSQKQDTWIQQLKETVKQFKYNHITEHFGFMTSGNFHEGCPLPTPLNQNTLAIGIDRLLRIQQVAEVPVGLENLAFAFSMDDVSRQGEFLERLVAPVNGFIILDLHNIYCQSHNFKVDFMDLISRYPLELVKEIHISGGSWEDEVYGKDKIRRDTHDGKVPEIIFEILPEVLKRCPFLEFVIFERLENTFQTEDELHQYRKDLDRIFKIIQISNIKRTKQNWGNSALPMGKPLFDALLYKEQQSLSNQLINANSAEDVNFHLENWNSDFWKPEMIETAIKMSKKWN